MTDAFLVFARMAARYGFRGKGKGQSAAGFARLASFSAPSRRFVGEQVGAGAFPLVETMQ